MPRPRHLAVPLVARKGSHRAAGVLAGALVLLLLAEACGGDDERDRRRLVACQVTAEHAAMAEAVAEAYEAGELGSQAHVQTRFGDAKVFDAEGHMLPYRELKGFALGRWNEWVANVLRGDAREQTIEAERRVRDEGHPGC